MINISDFDKADVLAALYNAAKPATEGYATYTDPMTHEEAQRWLNGTMSFMELKGKKSLRVNLVGDEFDETFYDQDNGLGAAQLVVDQLRLQAYNERRRVDDSSWHKPHFYVAPPIEASSTSTFIDPEPIPIVPDPFANAFSGGRSGGAGAGASFDDAPTQVISNDNPSVDVSEPMQQAEAPAEAQDASSSWEDKTAETPDSSSSSSSDSSSSYYSSGSDLSSSNDSSSSDASSGSSDS